jgi:beta-phosphoglucomutase-like phosphatase (HAD superfamily)
VDRRVFLRALELLCCSAAECLAVENAPLGVRSAAAAGLCCVGVLNGSPLGADVLLEAGAGVVVADLSALHARFECKCGQPAGGVSQARP